MTPRAPFGPLFVLVGLVAGIAAGEGAGPGAARFALGAGVLGVVVAMFVTQPVVRVVDCSRSRSGCSARR